MPFVFEKLAIPDVVLIKPKVFGDARGFFLETFENEAFKAAGIDLEFVQDNHSRSARGVLRGLHYQLPPQQQGKLLRIASGEIYDVAVDIRRDSPTFKQWVGHKIAAESHDILYIPPGFAHGFCVLSDWADVLYKTTRSYAPELERGIRWDDPDVGVQWPIDDVSLSERDKTAPLLADAELP